MNGSKSVGHVRLTTSGMTTDFMSGRLDQLFALGPGFSWAHSRAAAAAGSTIAWAVQLAWVTKPVLGPVVASVVT